jgi:hypothetical protein
MMTISKFVAITNKTPLAAVLLAITASLLCNSAIFAQEALEPPTIGQETKGTPAVVEDPATSVADDKTIRETDTTNPGLFDDATIVERRRENGQIYSIELEHPLGAKQYIDDEDADGDLETTDNDNEAAPNLAKWRIGSW